jgi:hypothetical protein
MEILLTVQDVDVVAVESGLEQRIDGFSRLIGVDDRSDHAIRRVPDEVFAHWLRPFCSAEQVLRSEAVAVKACVATTAGDDGRFGLITA